MEPVFLKAIPVLVNPNLYFKPFWQGSLTRADIYRHQKEQINKRINGQTPERMNEQTNKKQMSEKQTHKCIKLTRVSIKMSTLLIVLCYILASKNQFRNVLCGYPNDIP